jgi:hypothetical protein
MELLKVSDPHYIVFEELAFGSISATMNLALAPNQNPTLAYDSTMSGLTAGTSGIVVISSTVTKVGSTSSTDESSTSFNYLWFILIFGSIVILSKILSI